MSPVPVLSIATDESALRSRMATERSASPDTPPYSPLTPILASSSISGLNEELHQQTAPAPTANQPPPQPEPELQQRRYQQPQTQPLLPFSESDNPDAIALRSALSILYIQRQKALRDLKTLERQKQIARADPEAFAADVLAGRVKTVRRSGLGMAPQQDHAMVKEEIGKDLSAENHNGEEESSLDSRRSKFDDMPGPQDIIRAPPINWAKYHIVGEPLDRLHEEQKTRPTPGQPRRDGDESRPGPKHVIAAPYSPWADKLSDGQARTRSLSKKDRWIDLSFPCILSEFSGFAGLASVLWILTLFLMNSFDCPCKRFLQISHFSQFFPFASNIIQKQRIKKSKSLKIFEISWFLLHTSTESLESS